MTTLVIDGLPVNLADAAAARVAIERVVAERDAAVNDANARATTIATHEATIAARDAEIVTLNDKLAKATDQGTDTATIGATPGVSEPARTWGAVCPSRESSTLGRRGRTGLLGFGAC